ncbi:pseudouridine synthase [Paucihalobacter sp.]|uniref:pseudouridine synthase n=1 Tax=Paucihalobacter sp. TaxID=2850405 RepID=UPI002FE28DF2
MTHQHFVIYKPYGYLSQFVNNQNKRRNKKLLGPLYQVPDGCMAIGRLDEKSEGLLMLTTDGKVSEYIRSISVEKEYWVMVDGVISKQDCEMLNKGVEIATDSGLYITQPCVSYPIQSPKNIPKRFVRDSKHGETSWLCIIVTEGKFRQIRKMTAKIGFPTLRLVRTRIGNFSLKDYKESFLQEVAISDVLG